MTLERLSQLNTAAQSVRYYISVQLDPTEKGNLNCTFKISDCAVDTRVYKFLKLTRFS